MLRLIFSPADWYDKNLAAQDKCEALYWKIHFRDQSKSDTNSQEILKELIEVCSTLEAVEIDIATLANIRVNGSLSNSDIQNIEAELKRISAVLGRRLGIAKLFSFLKYAVPVVAVAISGYLVKNANTLGKAQVSVAFPAGAYWNEDDELKLSEDFRAGFLDVFGDYYFEGKRYPDMYIGETELTHKFKFVVRNQSMVKSAFVGNMSVSVKRIGGNTFPYDQLDCKPEVEANFWYPGFNVLSKNFRPAKNLDLDVLVDGALITTAKKDFLSGDRTSVEIFEVPEFATAEFPYYEIDIDGYLDDCRRNPGYKVKLYDPVTGQTSYVRTEAEAEAKLQQPKQLTFKLRYEDVLSNSYQLEPINFSLVDDDGDRTWLSKVNWRVSLVDANNTELATSIYDQDADAVLDYLDKDMLPLADMILEKSGQNPFDPNKGVDLIIDSVTVNVNNDAGSAAKQIDVYLNADGLLVGYAKFNFKTSGLYRLEFQVNEEICYWSEVEILIPEEMKFKYPESLKLFTDTTGRP